MTIAAIAIGGWWFLQQGEGLAKANLSLSIAERKIDDHWTYLNVTAHASNPGKRPLAFAFVKARIQQVLPLDAEIRYRLAKGPEVPIDPSRGHVIWPLIGNEHFARFKWIVAPGESDTVSFDFFIPVGIKTIRVRIEASEASDNRPWFLGSPRDQLRWQATTLYDLKVANSIK